MVSRSPDQWNIKIGENDFAAQCLKHVRIFDETLSLMMKHFSVYHHQHRVCLGPPPQFSDDNQDQPAAVHQNIPQRGAAWNQPPPPYHMACPEPPPAYADVVPNLMDQNTPSTSRQHPALADVLFHGAYAPSDEFIASQMPSTSRGFVGDNELTQVLADGHSSPPVLEQGLPSLETTMQDQQAAGPSSAQ